MSEPTSTKPYLLRAIYEWCVDNGLTPYISVVVDANTSVPMEYVRDGEIVLNIGPLATSKLAMGNDAVECTARFSGSARELYVPITAVSAIYARENGHGMSFETERGKTEGEGEGAGESPPRVPPTAPVAVPDSEPPPNSPRPPKPSGGRPSLRRVK